MGKRYENNTKNRIAKAAWDLFNSQGYDNTTIEDILEAANTSRGTFYHYFEGKDALIASMIFVLDDEYERILGRMEPDMCSFEKMVFLDTEICRYIENTLSPETTSQLFGNQLSVKGQKSLIDKSRSFYRVIRRILNEGYDKGEISSNFTINEIINAYATLERGLVYDWCLCNGEYNLSAYAKQMMPMFLRSFFLEYGEYSKILFK